MSDLQYPSGILDGTDSDGIEHIECLRFEFYEPPKGIGSPNEPLAPSLKKKPFGDVYLYMPSDIAMASNVSWDTQDLKNLSIGAGLTEDGISGMFGKGADLTTQKAKEAWKSFLSTITGSGVSGTDFNDFQSKQIDNPYKKFLFRGVDFRNFGLEWTFIPHNEKQVDTIKEIQKRFLKATYPDRGEYSWRLEYPLIVVITPMYRGEEHPHLRKYKPSVITSVDINYTDSGKYVAFRNAYPVVTRMTLNLSEIEVILREDIEAGY